MVCDYQMMNDQLGITMYIVIELKVHYEIKISKLYWLDKRIVAFI